MGFTHVQTVLTFSNSVNTTIDMMKLVQINSILLACHWTSPPPSMTGNTGSTQGAKIVSIPATKAARYNPIDYFVRLSKVWNESHTHTLSLFRSLSIMTKVCCVFTPYFCLSTSSVS